MPSCEIPKPFEYQGTVWYCCNGAEVKAFGEFTEMMDFLISDDGNGWWPL